ALSKKDKYFKIKDIKEKTVPNILCEMLPVEFKTMFNFVRKLGFDETPNYSFLFNLITDLLSKYGFKNDGIFDWNSNKSLLTEIYKISYNRNLTENSSKDNHEENSEEDNKKESKIIFNKPKGKKNSCGMLNKIGNITNDTSNIGIKNKETGSSKDITGNLKNNTTNTSNIKVSVPNSIGNKTKNIKK
ncbi:MAG: hypothetical protein MJ252_07860, partial [archaeon]|nr:hypothetical protein [archaeon]